ncbi:GNAT family N-acetyltransferase [Clostridium sp. UBA1056]|uniref:GNAT family N-acetyltransferase n=1 Tax=unclassified Clostridium TaxID=2614128 RepID=UPI0032167E53
MDYLDEYKIYKANSEEWAKFHAIYRQSNFNEWMSLSFQSDIDRYKNVDFCYWVEKEGKRIGGAVIKLNILKCIFVIPPFNNIRELIEVLTLHVNSISDETKEIVIPDADLRLIESYKNFGFQLDRIEKLMVCATNEFNVIWEDQYKIIAPQIEHVEAMTKLYFDTYSSNKLQYIASQSYDFQFSSVQVYFKHIKAMNVTNEWSTLIFDTITNQFIGACIVGFVNGLPYILDFVVHPEFQKRGLGAKMIKRTLNLLFRDFPAIRLNVTVGNDAESFYDKLGFVSLAEKGYMIRKAEI